MHVSKFDTFEVLAHKQNGCAHAFANTSSQPNNRLQWREGSGLELLLQLVATINFWLNREEVAMENRA